LLVNHEDDDAALVEPTPASSAAHLDVLAGGYVAEGVAVELADAGEDDRLCRHVEAHGEGLCGEKSLDIALLEEDLDDLLQDR